jgi:nucleoside-diphosphate-sugar epimerase
LRILITGANGFIGHSLAERLCKLDGLGDGHPAMTRLTLASRKFLHPPQDSRIQLLKGDIVDRETLLRAVEGGVDCVFHIASIPTGDAERDFDAGRRINLEATYNFFEILRAQPEPPIVVYSSSIGVYGTPHPPHIDDATLPTPSLSYGAQKLIGEILVTDYSRRGFFDGRAIRLPGVVARPQNDGGAFSLFLSNIFHAFANGDAEFPCPVSAKATVWLMSLETCVDNLVHAARMPASKLSLRRAWMIPTLRVTMEDLERALAEATGSRTRVVHNPTEPFESGIGQLPPVSTPLAEGLGFRHDGTLKDLVERVLRGIRAAAPAKS